MPSPVGHSLIGLIIDRSLRKAKFNWLAFFLVFIIANLPDLDFIPGILAGEPNKYHHGISHSFGAALILAAIIFLVEKVILKSKVAFTFWFFILYSTHLLADFFAIDTRFPFGQPLFWPVSNHHIIFPLPFLLDIQRANSLDRFFPSLFSIHNIVAILLEICFSLFVWWLIVASKRIYRKQANSFGS